MGDLSVWLSVLHMPLGLSLSCSAMGPMLACTIAASFATVLIALVIEIAVCLWIDSRRLVNWIEPRCLALPSTLWGGVYHTSDA